MIRYVTPSLQASTGGRYQVEINRKPVPSFFSTAMGVALGRAVAGRVSRQVVPAALVTPQSWPVTPAVRVILAKVESSVTVPPLTTSRRMTIFEAGEAMGWSSRAELVTWTR